jgi:hypothetical protein
MDLISKIFKILFEDSSFFSKEKPFNFFFPNTQIPKIRVICNKVIVDNFDVFLQFRLRFAKKILRSHGLNLPRLPNRVVLIIIKYLNNYFMKIFKDNQKKSKAYKIKQSEKLRRKRDYWIEKLKHIKLYDENTYVNKPISDDFVGNHYLDEYENNVGDEYIDDSSSEVSISEFEQKIPRTESFYTYDSHNNYGKYLDDSRTEEEGNRFDNRTYFTSQLTQEAKIKIKTISKEIHNNYDTSMKLIFYFKLLTKISNNNITTVPDSSDRRDLFFLNFNRLGQIVPCIQFLFYTPNRLQSFDDINLMIKTFVPLTSSDQLQRSFLKDNESLQTFFTLLEFESDPYAYFSDMLEEAICFFLR